MVFLLEVWGKGEEKPGDVWRFLSFCENSICIKANFAI
jgi:hypothetical protein